MIQYFLRVPCFFLIKHLPSFLFFIGVELIHKSSFSYPFDELLFFYYKRVIEAIHSFKFTVFLQNTNCGKEILTMIIISPWFQACIYWKKFLSWQYHFLPSIFSGIVSLFHGSTWRNSHIKETVFSSHHFLKPPKPLWPFSFESSYFFFHRTRRNKYFWKGLC